MAKVNPEILSWARESAGVSLEDAARAIGLTGESGVLRLQEMEVGHREPTRRQLLKMAARYRRPLLTFYLPERPVAVEHIHDFRSLRQREAGSEALVAALVRDVRVRQILIRSALEDAEEDELLPFVASMRLTQDANALARGMRDTLQFDRAAYRSARTVGDAFRMLRQAVEAAGVFVLLIGNLGHHTTNLNPGVFRGMALADPVVPFIVVNETDSRSAWPFTLLHEFAHILLGESGISGYEGDQAIERLCDDAAALFLLDPDELRQVPVSGKPFDGLVEEIGAFAYERKLSRKMVAYNMLRTGLMNSDSYRLLAERFDKDRLDKARRTPASGAPDYYVVRRHRVGQGLLKTVDRMVAGGVLSSTKAGKVLGVKPTAVGRMTENAA